MKKTNFLIILFILGFLTSCSAQKKHADPFYNINDGLDPRRIPLVKPIELNLTPPSYSWDIFLTTGIYVDDPNSKEPYYFYGHVFELEKFAVNNGIIMAYSSYIDEEADSYIQDNYYHWFVLIPGQEITKGFHTEDEFNKYIQSFEIEKPDWQTPDKVYKQFKKTGCLDWIPDCAQKIITTAP
jgi:hypothetical protein